MSFRSRSFLLHAALLALLAMLATVLMPAAAQFVRAGAPGGMYGNALTLGEICSVSAAGKSADPAKQRPQHGSAACSYCTLLADHPGVPPQAAVAVSFQRPLFSFPRLFYTAPYRLAAWGSAAPRGPPALS
ncbi:MAG TPA: DUF2946 family protein [Paucimonas sp.]|nr:DUF2946 family protein [Paucimonas sp.]